MLATFGLERLESDLAGDSSSVSDVDEFLAQAASPDPEKTQDTAPDDRSDSGHRPLLHHRRSTADKFGWEMDGPDLPTRQYAHHRPNTEFRATRHANRV